DTKPTRSSTNYRQDPARTAASQCSRPPTTATLSTASWNTRKNQQARLKSSPRRQKREECYATHSAKSQQYYATAQTRLSPIQHQPQPYSDLLGTRLALLLPSEVTRPVPS